MTDHVWVTLLGDRHKVLDKIKLHGKWKGKAFWTKERARFVLTEDAVELIISGDGWAIRSWKGHLSVDNGDIVQFKWTGHPMLIDYGP